MNPSRLRPAILLGCLCLISSCSSQAAPSLSWKDASGQALRFSETLPKAGRGGSRLGPSVMSRTFVLASSHMPGPASCLDLGFRAGPLADGKRPVAIEVSLSARKDGASPFSRAVHAFRGPEDHFLLPLSQTQAIRSITIALLPQAQPGSSSTVEDGAWAVDILGLEEAPFWAGFELKPDGLRISAGVSVFRKDGEDHVLIPATPDPAGLPEPANAFSPPGLLIAYGGGGNGRSLEIVPESGKAFSVKLRPSGLSTVIPPSLCGAAGGRLELVLPKGVEARAFALGYLSPQVAELADFGRILRAGPADPAKDYDLYRWDLLPSVLIFDFRDYATQDAYLRRLAFFVEKPGHKGKLMTDAELGGLHAWNAHDYRPEDIAAFFETARKEAFPLNAAELALRKLFLERGLLRLSGQAYAGGEGAFISISRESAPYLRTMFLTHESTHGFFFVDAAYRDFVRKQWKDMDKEEKWYWLLFLGWKEYDTSNSYLLANEYQAYLLQQVLPLAPDYFIKLQPSHILENHKELQPKMDAWMETYKDSFAARAQVLDAWVSAKYGFQAGRGASY